jgi:hypothetical protein
MCLQHMQGKALPIVKLCDWGYSKLAEAGPRTAVVSAAAAVQWQASAHFIAKL